MLLFGVLREAVGASEMACEVPAGASVGDVVAAVRERAGAVGEVWRALAVAVNEEYARRDRVVEAGDVVALLPPVSGGLPARNI